MKRQAYLAAKVPWKRVFYVVYSLFPILFSFAFQDQSSGKPGSYHGEQGFCLLQMLAKSGFIAFFPVIVNTFETEITLFGDKAKENAGFAEN